MTEALQNAPPASPSLARALEVLAEASPTTDEQLQAVLIAIQEVGQLPTGSCLPPGRFHRPAGGDDRPLAARLPLSLQACTGLVDLVERGGQLSSDLLESALRAVCRGLAGARARFEAAATHQLAAVCGSWSAAVLAAADTCLHSEAWHAAFHAKAGGGKEAYLRGTTLARDILKDDLLPLLGGAAAQLTADTGFMLAPHFRALLAMG